MQYYLEINMNRLELYEITRMNLKSIILNKRLDTKEYILHDSIYKSLNTNGTTLRD